MEQAERQPHQEDFQNQEGHADVVEFEAEVDPLNPADIQPRRLELEDEESDSDMDEGEGDVEAGGMEAGGMEGMDDDDEPDGLARGQQLRAQARGPGSQGHLGSVPEAAADKDEEDLIEFTDEDEEDLDATGEQMVKSGRDLQGIPWDRLRFSREHYRASRLKQYRNYVNVLPENPEEYRPKILEQCQQCRLGNTYYGFAHNNRTVTTTIVHFQLRNLVWATSRNDVFVVRQNSVNHWHPMTRAVTEVINLSGGGNRYTRMSDLGKVQVSTLCVRGDLVATGGFGGELVVKRLGQPGWVYASRISNSENGITNGLEICDMVGRGACVMAANNDCLIRVFEAGQEFKLISQWTYPWAVNYASMQPQGHLAAVVGDDPETYLTDVRTGNTAVHKLLAHEDYSFAAAWHPEGNLLATGNQDTTTVVWDIRKTDQPLVRLAGRMGAIRSLRWSPDGRHLAACEPADFVHVYDSHTGYQHCQEIDLFGEISGISFTPAGDCLYVGIADITYASLLAFYRTRDTARYDPPTAAVLGGHTLPQQAQPRFGLVES